MPAAAAHEERVAGEDRVRGALLAAEEADVAIGVPAPPQFLPAVSCPLLYQKLVGISVFLHKLPRDRKLLRRRLRATKATNQLVHLCDDVALQLCIETVVQGSLITGCLPLALGPTTAP